MNPVQFFQETKRILGVCPCCGEAFRLSDATIYTKEPPPRTPFDELESAKDKLAKAVERFDEQEEALKEKARAKGQAAAQKRLKTFSAPFLRRKLNPQDVKALFDPIEFVGFRGMTDGEVKSVVLLDRPADSKAREKVQGSLEKAVKAGNYGWKLLRIGDDGRVVEEGS